MAPAAPDEDGHRDSAIAMMLQRFDLPQAHRGAQAAMHAGGNLCRIRAACRRHLEYLIDQHAHGRQLLIAVRHALRYHGGLVF